MGAADGDPWHINCDQGATAHHARISNSLSCKLLKFRATDELGNKELFGWPKIVP